MPARTVVPAGLLALVLVSTTACGAGTELRDALASRDGTAPAAPSASAEPVPTPAAGPSAPPGPAGPCTGAVLAVSLGPPAGTDATGTVARDLILQNTGDDACVLRGFPSVVAVAGNEGTAVGDPALPVGERGGPVRLEPRAAAAVPLRIRDTATYDEPGCRPQVVRGLRILPPGGSGAVFVAREGTACATVPPDMPWATVGTVVAR